MMFIAGNLTGIGGILILLAIVTQGHAPNAAIALAGIIGCVMIVLSIAIACIEDDRRRAGR